MSKIPLSCKNCAKRYQVPESYAGQKFKCKGCGQMIRVPGGDRPPTRQGAAVRPTTRSGRKPTRADTHEAPAAGPRTTSRRTTPTSAVPKSKQNQTLLLLSGVACLVLIVLIGYFMLNPSEPPKKKKRKRAPDTVAEKPVEQTAPPVVKQDDPPDELDPFAGEGDTEDPDKKPDADKVAAKKPEPKKDEPKKPSLPRIPNVDVVKVPHLDSTSEEMRSDIDGHVAIVADPWETKNAAKARKKLKEIGDAAVPALLSKMVELDFSDEDQRLAMPPITMTLQEITKARNGLICRVGMQADTETEIHYCKLKRAEWFYWYKRYSKLK